MQIKKIFGILLALCFFMSVTVAAVSAVSSQEKKLGNFKQGFNSKQVNKPHSGNYNPGFNHEGKKRYHHPASWKYVQICQKEYGHNHKEYGHNHKEYGHNHKVCKMVRVYKPAYDEWR